MGNYNNITRATISNQKPGYSSHAWLASTDWFANIRKSYPLGSTIIDGEHEFLPDLAFIGCYALPKSVEVTEETFGEAGDVNQLWKPKVFIPGNSAALQAMLEGMLHDTLILLVQDIDESVNSKWQFGNERVPARLESVQYTSGNIYDGRKGWELNFIATERYQYFENAFDHFYIAPPYVDEGYVSIT